MRYLEFVQLIQHDSRFNEFRAMFMHEPLLRFVYSEKCILGSLSEKRIFHNALFNETGGIAHSTEVVLDDCYGVFTPFLLKGVWIPLSAGTQYSILPDLKQLPIIRNHDGQDECLFFVHPHSEDVFSELLAAYQEKIISVSALSLSSPRSLLVALPNTHGGFDPVMIKVSLNQEAQGVLRLLGERECALSVANTSIFTRILARSESIPLEIFEDPFSFVPKIPRAYTYGMSYRTLPDSLTPVKADSVERSFIIPLLAFYGQKNADFFKEVVQANGANVTGFLNDFFQLYLNSFMPLLLDNQLSIEAHGQNLLLVFDESFRLKSLRYRDMGGVNTKISEDDYALPQTLRNPALSYFENHENDAAKAIEHLFVWRGLYPLTKQLVKNADHFRLTDTEFDAWYQACLSMETSTHVLGNWTDDDRTSELHEENLDVTGFYRYGYVETLFGKNFIEYLASHDILDEQAIEEFTNRLYLPERLTDDLWVAPCTYQTWFDAIIKRVFEAHTLKSMPRSSGPI